MAATFVSVDTGTLGGVNFNSFAGDQFFTVVVPEPGVQTILAAAGLGLLTRRRRGRD